MQTLTYSVQRGSRQRWMLLAVLLTIAALILSACGAKIETQLGLESADKGVRTMQVSFDLKDNQDKIKGGTQALDASLRKHLPSGLEYGGIQSEGDKARATFTLPFSSIDEYRSKVASILKASGTDTEPQISIINSSQGLVQGIQVKENFTSKELLGWVPEALVVDGVIESSRKSSVFSSDGDTTVKFGDKEVKNSGGSTISAKDVQDRGFKGVLIQASEKDGGYDVVISFIAKEIMSSETSSAVDAFLNQVKPDGAELKKGLDASEAKSYAPSASTNAAKEEIGRTMTFHASSSQDLSDKIKKVLGASTTDLTFTRDVTEESHVFKVEKTVSGTLDCSLLCSPEGYGVALSLKNSDGDSYSSASSSSSSSSSSTSNKTMPTFTLVSSKTVTMKNVKMATSLGLDGSMEARILYSFPTSDIAGAEQKLKDSLAGGGDDETEVRQDGDSTIVSVKIRGKDQDEFNQRLGSYLNGSKITVTREGGYHPFGSDYTVRPEVNPASKMGSSYYQVPFEFTFKAPAFSSLDQQKVRTANPRYVEAGIEFTVNGGELSMKSDRGVFATRDLQIPASGLSMTDLIVNGIILALVLAGLILLFLFRKKIAAARAKGRERREATAAAYAATAPAAAGAAGAAYGAAQGYAAPAQGAPAQDAYQQQAAYPAQGGYQPQQGAAYAAGDDSPTQVFSPQTVAQSGAAQPGAAQPAQGEADPTVAMPAQAPAQDAPQQPAQPQPTQPAQPQYGQQQPAQPTQPTQFGDADGDVLQ